MTTEVATEPKKKPAKTGKKNALAGFLVNAIDGDVMRTYIEDNALDIDVEGVTDEQIGVALHMHFQETVKNDAERCLCEECLGVSSLTLETCPYCGDAGVEADEAEEPSTEEPAAAADTSDEDDEREAKEADQSATDEVETSALAAQIEAAEPKKTTNKKTREKKNMSTEAAVNGTSSKKNAALATTTKGSKALVSATDLDKAVHDVEKLKGSAAESFWELGKKIVEIDEKQLWKLRVTDKGAPAYKGFDAFVTAELKMSPAHAYNAMECARGYETAAEVRALGHTKAVLVLKAAPEDRPALAEKAKAGASKREIAKGVAESRAKHGSPKKTLKAKAGAKGAAAKAKNHATKTEKVSIANIEGSKTIKLFKRPESLRALDFSALPRAKRIGDVPFGKHELTNGVVQYFSVLEKDGELVLKIETRRDSTEE